jgi:hypothetical protein
MAKVNATLAADTLYGRVQEWWSVAMVQNGAGRGAVTRDLQYTEGLRNLRIDLAGGERLQRELQDLPNLSPSVRQVVQGDLTLYLKQIRDQIAKLEAGGYEAVFSRQKLLSTKRWSMLDQYGEGCLGALNAFDSAAALVRTEESFKAMEGLYKLQVTWCKAPG